MDRPFLAEMFSSIAERSRHLLRRYESVRGRTQGPQAVVNLCTELLSGRGEASGVALALEVLDAYQTLDSEGQRVFFAALLQSFGPNEKKLSRAIDAWRATPSDATAAALHFASEPRRQELLRRLNRAPGGTAALVRMRADLIDLKAKHPELAPVDLDFQHLLSSWFNRGFLALRRIDWSTPANILEKIIIYEAVHAIAGWDDLRRRIDPVDRRCYAFFHPAMLDEPLIFVEVALTQTPPAAIEPLLAQSRTHETLEKARTAAFYSISNCQRGLAGISFGNFLIKQVVEELQRELPQIETFVTLSPVNGFMQWLKSHATDLPPEDQALVATLGDPGWPKTPALSERLRRTIEPLAAYYFLDARTANGRPIDPVARFHLGNGARLERLNWLGDRSEKALGEAAGLMVNYLYDPGEIEANHEAFANAGVTAASSGVKRLLKSELRQRLQTPVASSTQ
jgi:malonyl-CoA decarboxylase